MNRIGNADEEVCLDELPEGCISKILSSTTPLDVCTLAAVSKTFLSAANSDDLWDKLLPSDLNSIISRSSSSFSTDSFPSKRHLFLSLCHNPILIDNNTKSFSLNKRSGKKCYMIAARSLMISWGDTSRYWQWINVPDSRFNMVAELRFVWWLDIRGRIDTSILSPATSYVAYLVYKLHNDAYGFDSDPIQASTGIVGGEEHTRIVHLVPDEEEIGLEFPKRREDGWLEVELGEYFNRNGEDQLDVRVWEVRAAKSGLLVQGIEIRPKLI